MYRIIYDGWAEIFKVQKKGFLGFWYTKTYAYNREEADTFYIQLVEEDENAPLWRIKTRADGIWVAQKRCIFGIWFTKKRSLFQHIVEDYVKHFLDDVVIYYDKTGNVI